MQRCRRVFPFLYLGLVGLSFGLGADVAAGDEDTVADTTFPKESLPALRRLEVADKLAAENKWVEALDDYRRITEDSGDVLIDVDPKKRSRCVQARRLIQARLASPSLPKDVLRLYRSRCDDQARAWLKAGTAARDSRILQRIVDEAFRSSVTDQALELLGDLAFERGCFAEAQAWWRMLALPVGEASQLAKGRHQASEDLRLPDVSSDRVARVRAKQIIARLFHGDRFEIADDVRAFETLHGEAAGPLAGSKGRYAAILKGLVAKILAEPPLREDDIWTTFAGSPTRNLAIPVPLSHRISANGCQWSARLDTGVVTQGDDDPAGAPSKRAAESLAFHPVITGNVVLWADARFVNAHDLLTGRKIFRFDLLADGMNALELFGKGSTSLPAPPELRYSLSVSDDKAFVRMGVQGLSPRKDPNAAGPPDKRNSFIVCLDLKPNSSRRLVWQIAANSLPTDNLVFEGAPLVREHRAYVAMSRINSGQTESWIACFDAETGKEIWHQAVCETKTPRLKSDEVRYRHHLLTLVGGNIVYCSHAGAIVAVDAVTGQAAWAFRYASRGPRMEDGNRSPRDLAPCAAAGGFVYAVPLDSDRLLCLSAETGRLVWEYQRVEVVHLLGASGGRVVFTTVDGIRAVGATSGADADGWSKPDDGSRLPGFGRGFLAGGWVFMPVIDPESALRILRAETGEQGGDDPYDRTEFHRLAHGNMTFANGCLVVAGAEFLYVYVPEERYLPMRQAEAARRNATPAAFYRLALAEADAGLHEQAVGDFLRAEQAAAGEKYRSRSLPSLARLGRHKSLLSMARLKAADKRWAEASDLFTRAAGADFPAAARVEALRCLAEMWSGAHEPAKAVAAWQALLAEPALHFPTLARKGGLPRSAWSVAVTQIDQAIRSHGHDVYAPIEKQAATMLASANDKTQARIFGRLAREFPNAAVTGPALFRLAALEAKANRPAAAARAYRQLLQHGRAPPLTEEDMASARMGLAQAYERQHRWKSARHAWQELAGHAGNLLIDTPGGKRRASTIAAEEMRKAAYQSSPPVPEDDLQIPLLRTWECPPLSAERAEKAGHLLVPAQAFATRDDREIALFLQGKEPNLTLVARSADSGRELWQSPLTYLPEWTGILNETAVLAGPNGIQCLDISDGRRLWEFRAPGLPPIAYSSSPLARLSSFQLTHAHLYCLQAERRLLALDVDTGKIAWSHWAPAGSPQPHLPDERFMPWYHAGEDWLVVQAGRGAAMVLESQTGRPSHNLNGLAELWSRAPLALGERRICLVPDSERVSMVDPATGKTLWIYPIPLPPKASLATGEAARVFGRSNVLFVLLARNYGYQLERLDPDTGQPLWSQATRLVREAPGVLEFDDTAVYYVSGHALHARALTSGKEIWSCPLSGFAGDWRVQLSKGYVLAYPGRLRAQARWNWIPMGTSAIALPVQARRGTGMTITICAASDGLPVERLHFPGLKPQSAVQVFRHRLVVEVDGQAWGVADDAVVKER